MSIVYILKLNKKRNNCYKNKEFYKYYGNFKMNNKHKNKGFTLIELVVVIVILGILAAVATPKYMDLTKDARAANLTALKGVLKSAVSIAHAKMVIYNQSEEGSKDIGKDCDSMSADATNCVDFGQFRVRYKNDYPDRTELYKLVNMDLTVYSGYNTGTRCPNLTEEQRTCTSDYCFCVGAQVNNSVIKSLNNSNVKTNSFNHTNSIFWPNGITIPSTLSTNDCFLMYIQPEKNGNNTLISPLYALFTDGC